jgi:hypothetical protein
MQFLSLFPAFKNINEDQTRIKFVFSIDIMNIICVCKFYWFWIQIFFVSGFIIELNDVMKPFLGNTAIKFLESSNILKIL